MVSKELLSEMFGWNIKFVNPRVNDNEISFVDYYGNVDSFNVYYVAYKCKEWAINQGYQFQVYHQCDGSESWHIGKCGYDWDLYIADSVFAACQWILDNKEK